MKSIVTVRFSRQHSDLMRFEEPLRARLLLSHHYAHEFRTVLKYPSVLNSNDLTIVR